MQRAVIPESLIAERRRLGLDHRDEMWEGVLHMNEPGSNEHQRIEAQILVRLHPLAVEAGLNAQPQTGVFDPDVADYSDFRTPDLVFFDDAASSERGVEGRAALAIEIRSPGDESFDKIPFYSRVGVAELLIIDRNTKAVRRWSASEHGLVEQPAGPQGWFDLRALPVALRGGDGKLAVRIGDRAEEI